MFGTAAVLRDSNLGMVLAVRANELNKRLQRTVTIIHNELTRVLARWLQHNGWEAVSYPHL